MSCLQIKSGKISKMKNGEGFKNLNCGVSNGKLVGEGGLHFIIGLVDQTVVKRVISME